MIRSLVFHILVAVVLVNGGPAPAAAPPDGISPRLASALDRTGHQAYRHDGRLLVWVHFHPRDLDAVTLDAALIAAAADLDPRAAARRARVLGANRVVGLEDLPVNTVGLATVRATGATWRHSSRWLNAASFLATSNQVRTLAALPEVRRVALVATYRRPAPDLTAIPPPPADKTLAWTLDYGTNLAAMEQANVPPAHEAGLSGRDVVVGVLDSGFRTTHEALRFIPVLDAWDFVNGDGIVDNEDGDPVSSRSHGTMVLSTLAGHHPGDLVAPAFGASVLLAKTEDVAVEVPLEEDNWVAGLEWAEARGADLITSSVGYTDWYEFADLDGNTAVTTIAADLAVARGLIVVTASGNTRATTGMLIAPADGDSVITVGAVDPAGLVTSFSAPGPTFDGRTKPDVAALGLGNWVANPGDDRGYGAVSGTSFSTPLTAGVVALMIERAPYLSPVEVRTALRGSASQAGSPDNDLGWGVIDAWAAVTWYGPVFSHQPLGDTEDTSGPYAVTATVTARAGLVPATLALVHRGNGGSWQSVTLAPGVGPDLWQADVPAQPAGTVVDYHLTGADLEGHVITHPVRAPARFHTFRVGPDVTPPVIVDVPLGNTTIHYWPPVVRCTVTDNLGVAGVDLVYRRNGGPEQGPFPMADLGEGAFELPFPRDIAGVVAGDVYSYNFAARDVASVPNTTLHGPRSFAVNDVAVSDTVLTVASPVSIPDVGGGDAVSLLTVTEAVAGTLVHLEVDIDLTHPDVGQLVVTLESVSGAVITLHNRTGAGTADLVGNWPRTLVVDGPGALADALWMSNAGTWLLRISDQVNGATGTLNSWSLRFTVSDTLSDTPDVPVAMNRLLPNVPNPFNPGTRIAFELAAGGRTRLAIYDVRGMLVRELLDTNLAAGPHHAIWDGRDGAGREMGSGVYLALLRGRDFSRERKLTLVR